MPNEVTNDSSRRALVQALAGTTQAHGIESMLASS